MSEHEHTSRSTDVLDVTLTDADVERAFGRTMDRGRHLVRRRNQRRTALGVLGAAVLLAGGFSIISSLSDDTPVVVTPAGDGGRKSGPVSSTTNATPDPTTTLPSPVGWPNEQVDGDTVFTNPAPTPDAPVIDAGGGVSLGGGGELVRAAAITDWAVVSSSEIEVVFACSRGSRDHIDSVRVRRDGDVITVQGTVTGVPGGSPCSEVPGAGLRIPVPGGPLTSDEQVVAGVLDGE